MTKPLRIAVDTGGTFTDIVVMDESSGQFNIAKVPTTPSNTMIGVLNAVDKLNVDLKDISKFFVHGATTAINALIEKKGVSTAYIGTEGFRDVPEIGRYNRPDMFNPKYKRPTQIVPRRLRFEVKERILFTGDVYIPLDVESVREVARKIKRAGVKAVAICFHHSYRNPVHEEQARDIILEECPDVQVSISSEVAKEHREYERGMTTIIDAYLKPVVAFWIDALDKELTKRGMHAELLLTRSDGGAMLGEVGKKSPVNTLLSGPAGGVMGGMFISQHLGQPDIINMDMGGTSFDVSIIKKGQAETLIETNAEGYELLIPNLDIRAVGAGGGSIGWIDAAGALHVGPQSAGAEPGPICYGQGGTEPTITDALVVSGYIDPNMFLGGEMPLDVELAKRGVQEKIASPLNIDANTAAAGMLEIAFNTMVHAIRGTTIERGEDPRDYALLCYGGGGALFGSLISDELKMKSSIIPIAPANFSAWGMLTVNIRHAFAETDLLPLDHATASVLSLKFEKLIQKGQTVLMEERIPEESQEMFRSLDMRYAGQEHTVSVPLDFSLNGDLGKKLKKRFEEVYHLIFGYTLQSPIEIVNFRVAAVGKIPNPQVRVIESGSADPSAARKGSRKVFDFLRRAVTEFSVYDRFALKAGNVVTGPALIEEPTTVTQVSEGSQCEVDKYGNLIIARGPSQSPQ